MDEFDKHKNELDWALPVEWAIFWHDAFYSTHMSDKSNVTISAHMALISIDHKSPEFQTRVESLIVATCHLEEPPFKDARFLCDFDLSILGQAKTIYDSYSEAIRFEYSWVPSKEYREKRSEILQSFLDRDHIYHTEPFQCVFEYTARKNIKREIENLAGSQGSLLA